MKLVKKYNNIELIIEEELLNKIGNIGVHHYPNEFGGFLIGKYSNDFKTLYIEDYILPKKYKGLPFIFERSIDGIIDIFKKLFKQKNQYYIGEWHTHPDGSTMYSQTDLNAMVQTVECETVQIKNPILLILSVSKQKLNNFTFYFFENNKLISYE